MSQKISIWIIVLLIILCILEAINLSLIITPPRIKYQHQVVAIDDMDWDKNVSKYGNTGWRIVSCRRAVSETDIPTGETDYNGDPKYETKASYECILERP